jgi:multiple sugar transport system permease protein
MAAEKTPKAAVIVPKKVRTFFNTIAITGLALSVLFLFMVPMVYGIMTALKTDSQFSKIGAPWWPASEGKFNYEGKDYDIYLVPMENGEIRELALVVKGRAVSSFVDPNNPEAGLMEWEGVWRQLERAWEPDPQWANFTKAWNTINFPVLLRNTAMYAIITTFGAVLSASLVAYGFARFRIPGKNILFMLMLSTVILPGAVTLIPTYFVFLKLGWVGTWLPLIVPAFFSWGTNVFLLRQFFLTIPRELDEAAMIDGAGPFRIFFSIILPAIRSGPDGGWPVPLLLCLERLLRPADLPGRQPRKFPITVGLTAFNNLYSQSTNLIQAASLLSAVIPVIVFFMAQRVFMQGIVVTGVEK